MAAKRSWPLRLLGWGLYGLVLVSAFALSGYFSFSHFVRSGVTRVPDLIGLPEVEAAALLRDRGLRPERRVEADRWDESVPAGAVVQQGAAPGSRVKRGSPVGLVLSLGQELVEVPPLEGSALQAAQVTLAAAGLTLGAVSSVYSTSGSPGTVVAQRPAAGKLVGRSAPVDLFLCLEDRSATFLMPDLVYRQLPEVSEFFERRRIRLGSVKYESYEGVSEGVVLRQFPLPGHPLRKNDTISLVVSVAGASG